MSNSALTARGWSSPSQSGIGRSQRLPAYKPAGAGGVAAAAAAAAAVAAAADDYDRWGYQSAIDTLLANESLASHKPGGCGDSEP